MSSTTWPIKDSSSKIERIFCEHFATISDPFATEVRHSFSDIISELSLIGSWVVVLKSTSSFEGDMTIGSNLS
jgi:hypothetical protein